MIAGRRSPSTPVLSNQTPVMTAAATWHSSWPTPPATCDRRARGGLAGVGARAACCARGHPGQDRCLARDMPCIAGAAASRGDQLPAGPGRSSRAALSPFQQARLQLLAPHAVHKQDAQQAAKQLPGGQARARGAGGKSEQVSIKRSTARSGSLRTAAPPAPGRQQAGRPGQGRAEAGAPSAQRARRASRRSAQPQRARLEPALHAGRQQRVALRGAQRLEQLGRVEQQQRVAWKGGRGAFARASCGEARQAGRQAGRQAEGRAQVGRGEACLRCLLALPCPALASAPPRLPPARSLPPLHAPAAPVSARKAPSRKQSSRCTR